MNETRENGACIKRAIEILLRAGCFWPGTAEEGGVSYVIKIDANGEVIGVDLAVTDKVLGGFLPDDNDFDE